MMKYGCTLETINVKASGPNAFLAQSKTYWSDIIKFIAAAGFKAIEMPYSPYTADPLAFEIGRAGNPISKFAVDSQYGGAQKFLDMLHAVGIEEIAGLHISVQDTLLDIIARFGDVKDIHEEFEKLAEEAVLYAKELQTPVVAISPSLEIGFVQNNFGDVEGYKQITKEMVGRICTMAKGHGVKIAVRNEFWSVFRGEGIKELISGVENAYYSPDTAQLKIAGCDFAKAVEEWAGKILLPKLSDTDFVDAENNYKEEHAEQPQKGAQRVFCDMGDGGVDFAAAAKALEQAGYDGWTVCECRKTTDIYKALLKMGWFLNHGMKAKGA